VSPTHAEPVAPAPAVRAAAQVQRCGGATCPPGTCDHDEEVARLAEGPGPAAVPPTVLGVLGTPGTPLDPTTRTGMEGRFGHDFSRVRIHTDAEAARSAADIRALAYTFGPHVVMGAGRYQPHTSAGQRLLAHELTHVVQQGSPTGPPTSVSDPHDAAEQAAERAACSPTNASASASPRDAPLLNPVSRTTVQRAAVESDKFEGGVVSSGQICYDLCTGAVSVVGWIWVGAGLAIGRQWVGAYHFWEGERGVGHLGHLTCGACSATCGGGHGEVGPHSDTESGSGYFPFVRKPGQVARIKKLGVEIGFLVTQRGPCDADLEVIGLFDVLEWIPSLKPPLEAAKRAAAAVGVHLDCGFGVDVSGSVHLCRNDAGQWTADHARICGGLFLGCGVGLGHDKGSLPGQHPVPARA